MAADRSHRADERARCDYGALGMATLVHTLTHSVESLPLGAGMALHLPVWTGRQRECTRPAGGWCVRPNPR